MKTMFLFGLAASLLLNTACSAERDPDARSGSRREADVKTATIEQNPTVRAGRSGHHARVSSLSRMAAENEEYFSNERRDDAWAVARELKIRGALERVQGARPVSVGCKAKLCRIELAFSDERSQLEFRTLLSGTRAELFRGGTRSLVMNDLESHKATFWLSRPGYQFPGAAQSPQVIRTPRHAPRPSEPGGD